ncbi:leucine zipper protein 2 [Willisornis vidua]|uniref:Leucine zipper protein 2 n=1 Tax=Willisornis vidua TaxID=1566151 RepID=A0ABQ9D387_9PASS|nr:leucine zipper protein 2 [Willisornis vidua]
MERKSKMIRDLQNEGTVNHSGFTGDGGEFLMAVDPHTPAEQSSGNKSLKNKLLSGNKLCGIHAEESKKIQAQLKELRYGKKDLIFKAQQLTDLEQKLAVAKEELEKTALDKVHQNASAEKENFHVALKKQENQSIQECDSQDVSSAPLGIRVQSGLLGSSNALGNGGGEGKHVNYEGGVNSM